MQRVFGRSAFPGSQQRPIATIGMFDGVHLGHQAVVEATTTWAQARGVPSVAITFDVHPRRFFHPASAPAMITSLEHRLVLLARLQIDVAWVLSFDEALARESARDFAMRVFAEGLRVGGVVLGPDARFGRDRQGGVALLKELGGELDFAVRNVPAERIDEQVVSSTAIRNAVQAGELQQAAAMLGRPVSILGSVVSGRGLGRHLGFPTLNLDPHHELRPPQGVYLTCTRCGDTLWRSVTNVGHRPTVDAQGPADVLVESHLLDYRGMLYGQTVEVLFLERLRAEERFGSLDAMAAQIEEDVAAARAYFAGNPRQSLEGGLH